MKKFNIKIIAVFISVLCLSNVYALDQGSLSVTSITPTQTLATANNKFEDGWQWIFNITIPTNETALRIKFADWVNASGTIPAAANIRIFSPQATNANSTTTAKVLSAASTYSEIISIDPTADLFPSLTGRQIQVVIEVKAPEGSFGGSYASSYGVSTDIDSTLPIGVISAFQSSDYENNVFQQDVKQVIVGKVLMDASNEDVQLNSIVIDPRFSTDVPSNFNGLFNLKVLSGLTQIASTTDWYIGMGPNPKTINFDGGLLIPQNIRKDLTFIADVSYGATTTSSTSSLRFVIRGNSNNAIGLTTNKFLTVIPEGLNLSTSTLIFNTSTTSLGGGGGGGGIVIPPGGWVSTTTQGLTIFSNSFNSLGLVQGQANAKIAEFAIAGNGDVSSISLNRIGLSNNSIFSNVYLYDGNIRLTDGAIILPDGTINFTSSGSLFTISGLKIITVRADVNSFNASGQSVGVGFKTINLVGGPTNYVVGVQSQIQNISSIKLPLVNFVGGNFTNPAAIVINAGTNGLPLWSRNVAVAVNPVKFNRASFKFVGSAPSNAVTNFSLFVDGSQAGSATMDANFKIRFILENPIELQLGSHLIEVRGDVVGGSGRSFYIVLESSSDVEFEDPQFAGIYIYPSVDFGQLANLFGGVVSINYGSVSINQDPSFNQNSVISGSTNVRLGVWKFSAHGEDLKITSLAFSPNFFSTNQNTLSNAGLYVNGTQISQNMTMTNGVTNVFANLGTNVIIPAGQDATIEIRGDLIAQNGVALDSGAIQINIMPGSNNVQGLSSASLSSSAAVSGQTLAITSGQALTYINPTFVGSSKSPNSSSVKIGSFIIGANSAEGININQITIGLAGTAFVGNQISNLVIRDGANAVSAPIGVPVNLNNFSTNIPLSASSTKTFDLYADIGLVGPGSTIIPSINFTYRGSASNISHSSPFITGPVTTFDSPLISSEGITYVPGLSPVQQYVVGGQNNFNIGTFNFKVGNGIGGATIQDLTFVVGTNTISSITVYGKNASVINGLATISNVGIVIPGDISGVNVPVTVALNCVGIQNGCSLMSPSIANIMLLSLTYNDGSMIQTVPGILVKSNDFHVVGSKPNITVAHTATSGLTNGNNKVGEFTISADAAGDIELFKIPIILSTIGGATIASSSVILKDNSGSVQIVGTNTLSGSGDIIFTNPYKIVKGTSVTFTLYADMVNITGAASTNSVSFALGPQTEFIWIDNSIGVAPFPGTFLNNYPYNTQTKLN